MFSPVLNCAHIYARLERNDGFCITNASNTHNRRTDECTARSTGRGEHGDAKTKHSTSTDGLHCNLVRKWFNSWRITHSSNAYSQPWYIRICSFPQTQFCLPMITNIERTCLNQAVYSSLRFRVWTGPVINIILLLTGAIFAEESVIRVDEKTSFSNNSAQGEIVRETVLSLRFRSDLHMVHLLYAWYINSIRLGTEQAFSKQVSLLCIRYVQLLCGWQWLPPLIILLCAAGVREGYVPPFKSIRRLPRAD